MSQDKAVPPDVHIGPYGGTPMHEHGEWFSLVYRSSMTKLLSDMEDYPSMTKLGGNKSTHTSLDKLDGRLDRLTRYSKPNWPLDFIPLIRTNNYQVLWFGFIWFNGSNTRSAKKIPHQSKPSDLVAPNNDLTAGKRIAEDIVKKDYTVLINFVFRNMTHILILSKFVSMAVRKGKKNIKDV
jgi:hypothetical protein